MDEKTDSFGNALGTVQGAVNAIAAPLSMFYNDVTNKRNREFAREQATTAYNRQIELMNMQNDYNSPARQMQRLVDAGLNPFLAQGGMSNSLAAPEVSTGNMPYSHVAPIQPPNLLAEKESELMDAQIDNIRADASLKGAYKTLSEAEVKSIFKGLVVSDEYINNLKASTENLVTQSMVNGAHMHYLYEATNLTMQSARQKSLENTFQSTTMQAAIQKFIDEARVTRQEADLTAKFMIAQISNLRSQSSYYNSLVGVNREYASFLRQSTSKLWHETIIASNFRTQSFGMFSAQRQLYEMEAGLLCNVGFAERLSGIINLWSSTVHNVSTSVSTWFSPIKLGGTPVSNPIGFSRPRL